VESFSGKLPDELPDREVFDTLLEAKVLIGRWRGARARAGSRDGGARVEGGQTEARPPRMHDPAGPPTLPHRGPFFRRLTE
jgi:hypothetical protein